MILVSLLLLSYRHFCIFLLFLTFVVCKDISPLSLSFNGGGGYFGAGGIWVRAVTLIIHGRYAGKCVDGTLMNSGGLYPFTGVFPVGGVWHRAVAMTIRGRYE